MDFQRKFSWCLFICTSSLAIQNFKVLISTHNVLTPLMVTRPSKLNSANVYFSLERRWSSRTFRYGYLVTTSPQSLISPSTASSLTGWTTGFGRPQLPWCDGRCVQDPGTHSPRHSDSRLLATPTSCGRVSAHNPNWDRLFRIRSRLLFRCPLYRPL